ncbi:MAG TPA: response regulator [Candidatus Hydrogenedentes bacterium]|nr:response regulator [Candidatus Hydrogenedentota bacterium]
MEKSQGKLLAAFVEQRLEALTDHLVAYLKAADEKKLRSIINMWLINQAAYCGGKPYRAGEWASKTVDYFQNNGRGVDEARRAFRHCRNETIAFCLNKVKGLSDKEVYDFIMESADIHEAYLNEYCTQHAREMVAAERRKSAMIVEAVVHPLALLNEQGFIETANLAFARRLGVTPESLAGRDMLALCNTQTAGRMRTALRHKSAGKQLKSFAGTLVNGKNKIKAFFHVQPLFDSAGVRSGAALCLETDMPETDKINDDIRYVEDCLLGAIPFPLQMLNESGAITYSSDAVKTLGLKEYDNKEPLCCFLYRGRYGAKHRCPCRQTFETGRFFTEEFCYTGPEGTRWFMLIMLPVPDRSGNISRALCCVYDMTQRHQIQKQLETEIITQQRSSLTAQVAVTVAHQLRNPLSVVLGFAEVMAKGLPTEQTGEAINRILRNAVRCKDIVEKLLAFGKGTPMERRTTDFSLLVRESVRPMLAPSQSALIEWRLTEQPAAIECVPEQLTQVILSLIDNALRAAESKVVCTLEVKGDAARLRVADDGPGVPTEFRDRIFEPFFTTQRDKGAVGLGLTLARAVANDYGGSLTLSTAIRGEPDGACMVLQLPLLTEKVSLARGIEPGQGPAPASPCRALVVDDEADLLDLLKTALYMRGYLTDAVSSGVEAMEKLAENTYDAVVLDYLLSGALSGADVYAHIKERFPQLAGRIVFITADTMNYQTRLFLEKTGCPVLEKPFLTADLTAILKKVISP